MIITQRDDGAAQKEEAHANFAYEHWNNMRRTGIDDRIRVIATSRSAIDDFLTKSRRWSSGQKLA